jgi:ABC-type lipoprotein export system ATPase subunit
VIEVKAIEVKNLWRVYKIGHQEISALRGISLYITTNKFVALKGRSGSGKTTLLNCLAGLDRPTAGDIRVLGRELLQMSDDQLTKWRSREIGLVFQSFGLMSTLSAYENVELMLRLAGVSGKKRYGRTMECLALVNLERWADHRPYELSGGQQQRVAIARALANNPKLILADEPTGELDSNTAREILSLFQRLSREEQITILTTSHDPLIDSYVDQLLLIKDGQLVD